jgi:hypothetical protein
MELLYVKSKSFAVTSHEDSERRWNVELPSLLWHSAQLGRLSCQLHTPAPLYPNEISWYWFLLEAEWTPGLLSAVRRNRSLENLRGPYGESQTEPPVLWRSALFMYLFISECFCNVQFVKFTFILHFWSCEYLYRPAKRLVLRYLKTRSIGEYVDL